MQSSPRPLPPPNPNHQRQVFWQVWLPLGIFLIVFVGLCVLAALLTSQGNDVAAQWAALSVIIVSLPACLSGLFTLLFLLAGIFVSDKAIRGLPGLTYQVQIFFRKMTAIIHYYADRIVSPVISLGEKWAGFASLFKPKNKKSRDQ